MLLKKQVRGGVLLYALFMAGIFTLLLHVYLEGTTTYEVKDKQVIVRVASKGQIKTYRYVKKQKQK